MVIGEILGVEKVVAFVGSRGPEVSKVLRLQVRNLAVMLSSYVKTNKLTGEVLKVQTGRLRRSITSKVLEQGSLVSGLVGTNVEYARAHEFGVDKFKVVTVRDYIRKCASRNSYGIKRGGAIKDGSGKTTGHALKHYLSAEGIAHVHSFQRNQHTKLPERSFLRTALAELAPGIREDLANAIRKALTK